MNRIYNETQVGYFLAFIFGAVSLFYLYSSLFSDQIIDTTQSVVFAVVLLSLLIFLVMRTTVSTTGVLIRLGFGLIHKQIDATKILSARIVQPRWYHGIGIHFVGRGSMLINVNFSKAVEVSMLNGSSVWIGTAHPEKLLKAIQSIQP
ncbi:MAG: hypothetical protein ACRCXV_07455 [Bacteroidales bacterium]